MTKLKAYFLIFAFSLALGSCQSRKKASPSAETKDPSSKSRLSENQRLAFDYLFFNANKAKILGNKKEAISLFEEALKIDPENHATMYLLGQVNLSLGNINKTIFWTEKAAKLDPSNTYYKIQLASALSQSKQHLEAARIHESLINKKPENPEHYLDAANEFIYARKFQDAIAIYDRMEKKFGVSEEVIRQKEQLYLSMNKPEKAIAEIQKLIKAYPEELRYQGLLAELYLSSKNYEKAFETYQKVLKQDPANGYAHFGLAEYYRAKGNNEQAFIELKKGFADRNVALKTKLPVILSFMQLLREEKIRKQALELAEIMVETHPDESIPYAAISDIYYESGEYLLARENLQKSLSIEPSDFNMWQKLLVIDDKLGNFDYMQDDSEKALELFPNQLVLYVYNTYANARLKNYEKVISVSQEGLSLTFSKQDKIHFYTQIGDAAFYLKRYQTSDSAFDNAIRLDSNNTLALNNFAYFLSLRGEKLEKAERMARKANEIDPGNASYLDTYGWVLYKMKRYAEAETWIKKSLEKSPNSPDVLEHYGDILFRQGKTDEALRYWKKSKENGGASEFLDKKIRDVKLYE